MPTLEMFLNVKNCIFCAFSLDIIFLIFSLNISRHLLQAHSFIIFNNVKLYLHIKLYLSIKLYLNIELYFNGLLQFLSQGLQFQSQDCLIK